MGVVDGVGFLGALAAVAAVLGAAVAQQQQDFGGRGLRGQLADGGPHAEMPPLPW